LVEGVTLNELLDWAPDYFEKYRFSTFAYSKDAKKYSRDVAAVLVDATSSVTVAATLAHDVATRGTRGPGVKRLKIG
jgi:hypothetical protein